MTKLAETYFHLDVRLPEADAVELRSYLYRRASAYGEGLFGQTAEFDVNVEDGSIRAWLIVVGALYIGIGQYGSFRSGIDYAIKDARSFSEHVLEDVRNSEISDSEILRFERRLGVPGKIKRVFRRLERLEAHGQNLSKTEYEGEIRLISRGLHSIFRAMDDERDRALLFDSLPIELRATLPERLPTPEYNDIQRVGLRPKELELPKPHYRLALRDEDEEKKQQRLQDEILYRFRLSNSGFRLIPDK